MSEEKENFGEKAKEFAREAEEEVKKTAREFAEGAKEAFDGGGSKRLLAGILAIVLGGFGVHKFILGYNKEGIILLVATLLLGGLTCGTAGWLAWIIGLVEGIIYLSKSDAEFYRIYQLGRKPWF